MKVFENDPELREIIHIATEFDDLRRLVPKELGPVIADAKRRALGALEKMPACDFQQGPWLYKLFPIDRVAGIVEEVTDTKWLQKAAHSGRTARGDRRQRCVTAV
jgi:Protein of unknown function (DUF3969)